MCSMTNCPICEEGLLSETTGNGEGKFYDHPRNPAYDCPRCGRFNLPAIQAANGLTLHIRSLTSHHLRCRQRLDGIPVWLHLEGRRDQGCYGTTVVKIDDVLLDLDERLPSPAEQADRLILWIGDNQPSPGEDIQIPTSEVCAWIRAAITRNEPNGGYAWLREQEEVKRLVKDRQGWLRLTMAGWERYEAIKHRQIASRTAFMAMKFSDLELNQVVESCFKPAAKRAGFELKPMTDGQPAGLIDDQMRVALRTSRFVVADLTHGNRGTYWEAGFAEGLGRAVIYTCRKDRWDEVENGERLVHFDTGHLVTILWESEKLGDAGKRLTATIRATLPAEAQMADP